MAEAAHYKNYKDDDNDNEKFRKENTELRINK